LPAAGIVIRSDHKTWSADLCTINDLLFVSCAVLHKSCAALFCFFTEKLISFTGIIPGIDPANVKGPKEDTLVTWTVPLVMVLPGDGVPPRSVQPAPSLYTATRKTAELSIPLYES